MFEYNATLQQVVDADTLRLNIDLGFHVWVTATVRLARCDAPERGTLPGLVATSFVSKQLQAASAIRVQTHRSEKYGRWLGEILFTEPPDEKTWLNLSDLLIAQHHARPYSGGKR